MKDAVARTNRHLARLCRIPRHSNSRFEVLVIIVEKLRVSSWSNNRERKWCDSARVLKQVREVFVYFERHSVVLPSQAVRQRQIWFDLPCILHIHPHFALPEAAEIVRRAVARLIEELALKLAIHYSSQHPSHVLKCGRSTPRNEGDRIRKTKTRFARISRVKIDQSPSKTADYIEGVTRSQAEAV